MAFDSVRISNPGFHLDTVLHFPDSVLTFHVTDVESIGSITERYALTQNYPNPFYDQTQIDFQTEHHDEFTFILRDVSGRELTRYHADLERGSHRFAISGANRGVNFLTVTSRNYSHTIKLIQATEGTSSRPVIQHLGLANPIHLGLKESDEPSSAFKGNELMITGYYNGKFHEILDTPIESTIYHLDFDHPECPESVTDSRDGYIYPVQKIGCQCWMAENLRFLPSVSAGDVGSAAYEHYYVYGYNGSLPSTAMQRENFETYGVLYNWYAAMQGLVYSQGNVQGVCPDGWRLPNDEDWKMLEMSLGMSEQEANNTGYRGNNEGSKLAGTLHLWFSGYVTANEAFGASGFNAVPGGGRYFTNTFDYLRSTAVYWSATKTGENNVWIRSINTHYSSGVHRTTSNIENGFSVRCIKTE